MITIIRSVIMAILGYIIGSIPTGYIVVKVAKNEDIRTIGSGSTGATNVKRVMGKKWFFIVLLLDALKGATPVLIAKYLLPDNYGITAVVAAIFVILGHSKSIFLNFSGGKSVASGVGTILALNFLVGVIIAVIWATITYTTKYVSVGSIIALLISPFLMFFFQAPIAYVCYCALGAIYIVYLHRENIKRLIAGNENKVR
jgi:glycerol-3-phosphate acyltransferase PlsY